MTDELNSMSMSRPRESQCVKKYLKSRNSEREDERGEEKTRKQALALELSYTTTDSLGVCRPRCMIRLMCLY
jgi:hypothetical protein